MAVDGDEGCLEALEAWSESDFIPFGQPPNPASSLSKTSFVEVEVNKTLASLGQVEPRAPGLAATSNFEEWKYCSQQD